jgi:hypothetical protein
MSKKKTSNLIVVDPTSTPSGATLKTTSTVGMRFGTRLTGFYCPLRCKWSATKMQTMKSLMEHMLQYHHQTYELQDYCLVLEIEHRADHVFDPPFTLIPFDMSTVDIAPQSSKAPVRTEKKKSEDGKDVTPTTSETNFEFELDDAYSKMNLDDDFSSAEGEENPILGGGELASAIGGGGLASAVGGGGLASAVGGGVVSTKLKSGGGVVSAKLKSGGGASTSVVINRTSEQSITPNVETINTNTPSVSEIIALRQGKIEGALKSSDDTN